jgi:hypothetical protein
MMRRLMVIAALICGGGETLAAQTCAPATEQRKSAEPLVDWYDNYVRPYRSMPGGADTARLTKSQVEDFIEFSERFNRRAVLDPLIFESFVQQIMDSYARAPDFKGIDTATAEKIYKPGNGEKLDFSLFCISSKSIRTPDDSFAITVFGVVTDDCQHMGLRGLVFTAALVNGSANGQCRPDQKYAKMLIVPVHAGTNEITFVCGKDFGGCARQ